MCTRVFQTFQNDFPLFDQLPVGIFALITVHRSVSNKSYSNICQTRTEYIDRNQVCTFAVVGFRLLDHHLGTV
jgi:hypothetical protein